MLDIDRQRGTIANAAGPMLGTATGGLLSGLLVQYLPAPTHLVYLVLFGVFVLQSIGLLLMPESVHRKGRSAWLAEAALLLARARPSAPRARGAGHHRCLALAGFYASLGPSLVRSILGSRSLLIGGLAIFVLAASGASITLLLRGRSAFQLLSLGTALLASGVGLTLFAIGQHSAALFFSGTSLAGMGFGTAFQGSIRSIVPLALPGERTGVLSVVYVISYAAMGVPAVAAGLRVVYGGGLLGAAREYGVVVIVLSMLALAGAIYRRLRE